MIFIQLQGGLGNQMFQYAAGRALALAHGVELALDLTALKDDPLREYALDCLRIAARPALPQELAPLQSRLGNLAARRLGPLPGGRALLRLMGLPVLHQAVAVQYDPGVAKLPGHAYLAGFFQSERYFAHIAPLLREEFRLAGPLAPESERLAETIRQTEAVSIHVRRTDYVDNPAVNATHGVLTPGHYARCVERLGPRLRQPTCFVFSDDPDWAEANIRPPYPTIWVRPRQGASDADDLMLMSLCRHNILANSSFSWWAAWLNPHPDKLVLAPERWFSDTRHCTRDIIPSGWETV